MYVNDTLSTCHRAHASIVGLPSHMPGCAGLFLEEEIKALIQALSHPQKPLMAIIGGAKISTNLGVVQHLLQKVDMLAIG